MFITADVFLLMFEDFSKNMAHEHSQTVPFYATQDPTTSHIYTLSLHDALPISDKLSVEPDGLRMVANRVFLKNPKRSEEHTSELQSQSKLVCRLLLEKKNARVTTLWSKRLTS